MKMPADLAKAACKVSKVKVNLSVRQMLLLGILGGAYIALAGWLMTMVSHDMYKHFGVGFTRFLSGVVFSVGLMMVVLCGSELFTGNCMMPLGYFAGCLPMSKLLRNWCWVYFSNFLGAMAVALMLRFSGLASGPAGGWALSIASTKMALPPLQALLRGILCNWVVVLAVWMMMSAEDAGGKIWASFFMIMTFVSSGFEHSVANMYFMGLGMLLKGVPEAVAASGLTAQALSGVTIAGYFENLVPVTVGNIIGGVLFVPVIYYFIFKDGLTDLE